MRKRIKGEGEIDFEKILPTPPTLKDTEAGSLEAVYTALFGSDEDVESIIVKYDGSKSSERRVAVPESLTKAYSENRLKAFLAVIRSHAAVRVTGETAPELGALSRVNSEEIPEARVLFYERMANNYNFNMKTYGVLNWYDWRVREWGTKWNADCSASSYQEKSGKDDKAVYKISFSTAWSPPEPVIKELANHYPELCIQLRYYEGGMGFQGRLRLKGNKTIEDKTWDYTGSRGG